MTIDGKAWNEELLVKLFWQSDSDTIKNIPISQVGNKDKLVWNYNSQGVYTVKSAYKQLQERDAQRLQQMGKSVGSERERKMWKRTWNLPIKGKLKHFLWRCCHNILLTSTQLARKEF